MNKIKVVLLILVCILTSSTAIAQWNKQPSETFAFSAGTNVVYDAGDLSKALDKESLNFKNPVYVNFQYFIDHQFTLLISFSYNTYVDGKIIDGEVVGENESTYTSFDFSGRYSFMELLNIYPFEPFVEVGVAHTAIATESGLMINSGFGFNYWITDNWAISTNAIAKFKTNSVLSNKIQFNAGIIFKINNQ